MRKYRHLLAALLLILICFVYLAIRGKTITVQFEFPARSEVISREFSGNGAVRLLDEHWEDRTLLMSFEGVSPGKVDVGIRTEDDSTRFIRLYVHMFGIITENEILGYSTGEIGRLYVLPTSIVVVIFLLLSLPIEYKVMYWLFRNFMMKSIPGWIPFIIDRSIYVKMLAMGLATYGAVAVLEYRKIRKVPMNEALKNME